MIFLVMKLVANLLSDNLTRGQYSVDFNSTAYNLSSGVFYYKLTSGNFTDYKLTSGNFTEVKKMMLLK